MLSKNGLGKDLITINLVNFWKFKLQNVINYLLYLSNEPLFDPRAPAVDVVKSMSKLTSRQSSFQKVARRSRGPAVKSAVT